MPLLPLYPYRSSGDVLLGQCQTFQHCLNQVIVHHSDTVTVCDELSGVSRMKNYCNAHSCKFAERRKDVCLRPDVHSPRDICEQKHRRRLR